MLFAQGHFRLEVGEESLDLLVVIGELRVASMEFSKSSSGVEEILDLNTIIKSDH